MNGGILIVDKPKGYTSRDVVNMIIEKCMINYTTFNNWRAGKCRIPELYKSTINIIANRSVF